LWCIFGVTGCDQRKAGAKPAPAAAGARPVQVVAASRRPMERALQVVGTLAAREEASIAAQVAGQLEKHYVELGDRVQAGRNWP
jgi:multidrug efflux pump subunit AcrA (membrane-fusion protein)